MNTTTSAVHVTWEKLVFQVVPVGVEIAIAFAIMASAHVCHFTWLKMPQPVFQVGFEKKKSLKNMIVSYR